MLKDLEDNLQRLLAFPFYVSDHSELPGISSRSL